MYENDSVEHYTVLFVDFICSLHVSSHPNKDVGTTELNKKY